jgi:hypothetical protein
MIPQAEGVPRLSLKILRIAAWGCVLAIVIGYLSVVPSIDQRIDAFEATTSGHLVVNAALLLIGIDLVALWCSSVWYAARRWRSGQAAGWQVGLLLATGFVGGLFYYFLYVRRHAAKVSVAPS